MIANEEFVLSAPRASHGTLSLTRKEFEFFCELIHDHAGIDIASDKVLMVEGRLSKRLRALGLSTFAEYGQYLKGHLSSKEFEFFINTLTTNKTEFFREDFHFDYLQKILAQQAKFDTAYIWSAACSSGEEVYSLAMVCEELREVNPSFDYKILGTDIDTEHIQMSEHGIYDRAHIANLPPLYQQKYFELSGQKGCGRIRVGAQLRGHVKFRKHNLIDYQDKIPVTFNVIFVRNVLFYFNKETTAKIVHKLVGRLEPGGLLFVSLTETLQGAEDILTCVEASIYQKKV
ncbi:MAG: protein-glutamate O-methyltransferase CheR [Pseudomonadales bacterium]